MILYRVVERNRKLRAFVLNSMLSMEFKRHLSCLL